MNVIITTSGMTQKKVGGYEVFCFNNDRLRIAFKGEHHVAVTKKGTGMVVKLADVSAIAKLLTSRGVPFSTEHVSSEKGVEYTSPQIQLTTEFVTNPDTQSLEHEVNVLIDVIDKNRNIHDLINLISNTVPLNYRRQMQPPPYFNPPHFAEVPLPGAINHGFQQPQGPSHSKGES